jgi:hypothetical protein
MFDFLPLKTRTRVLLAPQTTASGTEAYLRPSPGCKAINIRAIVKMGNATDLVLSLKYADDASGTNATAWPSTVAIYEDGVEQTAAKIHTVDDSSGNFIVDFCVDPATLVQDKYVGISYANSNASNLLTVEMIEDVAYQPTAT